MKLTTEKISLPDDISSDTCKGCAALNADVEMHGQKVRSVKLYCKLANVTAADRSSPIGETRRIRAAARKVLGHAIDPDEEYNCEALRNAAYVLSEMKENRDHHKEMRRILRPEPQGVVETCGTRRYRSGERPEGVWETNDGSAASRWLAAQGRKFKE